MSNQIILDVLYVLLFIAVAVAEYFHIVPQGTALAVLTGFVVGMKTQSFQTSLTAKGPSTNG